MVTLFVLLLGMLVVGAGIALGIVAHDRAQERQQLLPQTLAKD
jgi:hypothetical protein